MCLGFAEKVTAGMRWVLLVGFSGLAGTCTGIWFLGEWRRVKGGR
jgi:hypothetical protein